MVKKAQLAAAIGLMGAAGAAAAILLSQAKPPTPPSDVNFFLDQIESAETIGELEAVRADFESLYLSGQMSYGDYMLLYNAYAVKYAELSGGGQPPPPQESYALTIQVDKTIAYVHEDITVSGVLTKGGQPVILASIEINPYPDGTVITVQTDTQGKYSGKVNFPTAGGKYVYSAYKKSETEYYARSGSIDVAVNQPTASIVIYANQTVVYVGDSVTISGDITAEGMPSETILDTYVNGAYYGWVASDANGYFSFPITAIGVGTLYVYVQERTFGQRSNTVTITVQNPPPPSECTGLFIVTLDVSPSAEPRAGRPVTLTATMKNTCVRSAMGTAIFQERNPQGEVTVLGYAPVSFPASGNAAAGISWTPPTAGIFTIEVYVWISFTNPTPLAEVYSEDFSVF